MFYLARRPPLEFCTQVMKSSRKECSLVWRCRGRFPSRASRIVGEWDKARPFPRIPECDLHTCMRSEKIKIKKGMYPWPLSIGKKEHACVDKTISTNISATRYFQVLKLSHLKRSFLQNLKILLQFITLNLNRLD